MTDWEARWERDMERFLDRLMPVARAVQPRYRYFRSADGWMFVWTTETVTVDGRERYESAVYRPTGPGSRTGKASRWVKTRARLHAKRKDAKARALKLWRERNRA